MPDSHPLTDPYTDRIGDPPRKQPVDPADAILDAIIDEDDNRLKELTGKDRHGYFNRGSDVSSPGSRKL